MSKAWSGGSTTAWRKVRLLVLRRDRWVCQLCKLPIDPKLRPPHPKHAQVHHARGKQYGDDPRYLVAAHADCNTKVGDPSKHDPPSRTVTKW